MVRYRTITTNDPEYAQEKDLREHVLRMPLGLSLSADDLHGEDEQIHIVAEDEQRNVIGCVLVSFAGRMAKVRQLAIDEQWQGKGIGRGLMRRAEEAARERKFDRVMLHGRVASAPFFERLGYAAVSEEFIEVTIPHVRMEKTLPVPGTE